MNKIVWWNINTGGAQRVTDRLSSVFERLAECDAAVIGLTEAGRVVQPAIRALARKKGYSVVLGDGLSQRKGVSLLVDNSLTTTQPTTIDALTSQGNIVGQWAGAVVEGLLAKPVFVASVYNYLPYQAGVAESVWAAARRLCEGTVIAGGDWNFSRSCDGRPEGPGSGTPAFEYLERDLGWHNVLPLDQRGLAHEVPTWPMHAGRNNPRMPRQLDHVFADPATARHLSVSVDDADFRQLSPR